MFQSHFSLSTRTSILIPFLLNHNLPRGFLEDLIILTIQDDSTFTDIFSPVLQGLCQLMRGLGLDTDDYRQPLLVLSELIQLKIGNARPFCPLVSIYRLFSGFLQGLKKSWILKLGFKALKVLNLHQKS